MREDVIRAHAELPSLCEHIHLPLQSGSSRDPQGDAPHLHARALPRPRRADPRARARLRADDRHHRRLPGRDRGGLRADARGRRGGRLRRRLHVHLLAAPRDRGGRRSTDGVVPHEVKVERMERLVEVVQRRARERAQRFVGRTLDVLVEGPSRTDPSRLRGRSRHNKVVNFSGLAAPGEIVPVDDHRRHSQTLAGESSLLARAAALSGASASQGADATSVGPVCEHTFVRWDNLDHRDRGAGPAPRLPRARGRPPLRRAGGARHPLLRGPGEVRAQPRARGLAHAVPLDDQPVPGLHPCLRLLRRGRHADPDGRRDALDRSQSSGPATRSTAPSVAAPTGATSGRRCSRTGHRQARVRVKLEDGTELVASGDHRFLTGRGWKHVTGAEQGAVRRPHLRPSTRAARHGPLRRPRPRRRTATGAATSAGSSAGDGHLGCYDLRPAGSRARFDHRFRLALADSRRSTVRSVPGGVRASRRASTSSRPRRPRRWAITHAAQRAASIGRPS